MDNLLLNNANNTTTTTSNNNIIKTENNNENISIIPNTNIMDTNGINIDNSTIIMGLEKDDPRLHTSTKMEINSFKNNGKLKRSTFACVRCHSLKQKCLPSDFDDIYRKPCQRCIKTKRLCKFDLSKRTRKRRSIKKQDTDHHITNSNNIQSLPNLQQHLFTTNKNSSSPINNTNNNIDMHQNITTPNSITPSSNSPTSTDSSLQTAKLNSLPLIFPNTQHNSNVNTITNLNNNNNNDNNLNNAKRNISNPLPSDNSSRVTQLTNVTNTPKNNGTPHLNSSLKKQLHSLLEYQKNKVRDISIKLDSMCREGNRILESCFYSPEILDPISLNIITETEAQLRLNLYRTKLSFNGALCFIRLSEDDTLENLRKDNPVFLSVILWCASVIMKKNDSSLQTNMKLGSLVMHQLTLQIFRLNVKSIQLVESLLILGLWYNFPEWSNKTRYHIFNYINCCLIKDLGPQNFFRSFAMFNDDDLSNNTNAVTYETPLESHTNGARLTLLSYISSLNISIFLRQSIQYRWSSLTKSAVKALQAQNEKLLKSPSNSLYTIEENNFLILVSELNHILEKIYIYLHQMAKAAEDQDDPEFTQPHTQNLVANFKIQLINIKEKLPPRNYRTLAFYYSVEAYLHQYTLADYYKKFISNVPAKDLKPLPKFFEDAYIDCCNCCISSLEAFLNVSSQEIATLPIYHMSRVIYTVGMSLLKLKYLADTAPVFKHLRHYTVNMLDLVNKISMKLEEASNIYPFNNYLYRLQYVVALFSQVYANKLCTALQQQDSSSSSSTQLKTPSKKLGKQQNIFQNQTQSQIQHNLNSNIRNKKPIMLDQPENFHTASRSLNFNINTNPLNPQTGGGVELQHSKSFSQLPLDFNEKFNMSIQNNNPSLTNMDNVLGLNTANGILNNNVNNISLSASSADLSSMANAAGSFLPTSASDYNVLSPYVTNNISPVMNPSPSTSADNLNEYMTDIDSLVTGFNALNDEFWTDIFISDT